MILGIMGGMGPAATCDLYEKIIGFTSASVDQDHIHIIIDSNAQIPDRTQYICGGGEDPRIEMIRSVTRLEMMGAEYIAIPCNTAHYFYNDISRYTKAKLLHMIRETSEYAAKEFADQKDYLLLATTGVYISGVYKEAFKDYDLDITEPNEPDKQTIMKWIYKVKSGNFDIDCEEYASLIHKYLGDRKMPVILGCTELPLLARRMSTSIEYIDPTAILAKRCVEIAEGIKRSYGSENEYAEQSAVEIEG